MDIIPFLRLKLRVPDHVERLGIDESEIGESAYDYDNPQRQPEVRKTYRQESEYELRGMELEDRKPSFFIT